MLANFGPDWSCDGVSGSSSFTFLCTTNVAGELPQRSVDGVTSSGDICAPLFGVGTSNKAGGAEKRNRVSYRQGATALPAHPQQIGRAHV